ncbi:MAG: YlmC/YmxH family sporulation protein [Clostridia bacterium]|nr:YlmC/YmxH family sporulation protein [Clostridia bacterium]
MDESLTALTEKQVVNLCDGKILGYVIDFKIDVCSGRLTAIILPGESGFFGFKKCMDIIIPWEKICRIGEDAIIVDIGPLPKPEKDDNCNKKKKKLF